MVHQELQIQAVVVAVGHIMEVLVMVVMAVQALLSFHTQVHKYLQVAQLQHLVVTQFIHSQRQVC